ncbi:MAG: hypothetical protein ACE5JM_16900 [Armatimonadota bacterium]
MPERTTNRLRWERVPILGSNPVFCFEARRLWTRRTAWGLVLLVIGIGLASWAVYFALRGAMTGGSFPPVVQALMKLLGGVLPPSVPPLASLLQRPASSGPTWWGYQGPFLLLFAARWVVIVAGKYLVPSLTALSLAGDRAAGRLQPVLVSRMSPEQVLMGKLMAPVLPFLVVLLASAAALGPLSIGDRGPGAGYVAALIAAAGFELLVAGMVGLRVGASARQPMVAVGISLLIVLVVLPALWAYVLSFGLVWLERILVSSTAPPGLSWVPQVGSAAALYGLIFAALWFSTKHALARVDE